MAIFSSYVRSPESIIYKRGFVHPYTIAKCWTYQRGTDFGSSCKQLEVMDMFPFHTLKFYQWPSGEYTYDDLDITEAEHSVLFLIFLNDMPDRKMMEHG